MKQPNIVVIGSGFAGIGMGIQLRKAGYRSFSILSRAGGVGGVWWDNRYPGAACDVPSSLYSFSFEPNYDWSRSHGTHAEIRAYLEHCVRKYRLTPHLRFNTEVESADYDDAAAIWRVRTGAGEVLEADVLISACGLFNRPVIPKFPGRERFAGPHFHTTSWDPDFDPRGKRVAVIGTGCSAGQILPAIAPLTERLMLFQRTPAYVNPVPTQGYGAWRRFAYRWFPWMRRRERQNIFKMMEDIHTSRYDEATRKTQEQNFRDYLASQVTDEEKRRKLTPDFTIGCKRPVFSTTYLKALDAPNVDIVTSPIETIETDGIRTADGEHYRADAIVYATGFTPAQYLSTMRVTGSQGRPLAEAWSEGPEAYLGITVNGFPNFFMLYGPNTNGFTSIIFMIECQIDYILQCIRGLAERGLRRLEPLPDVQRRFNEEVQRELKRTVWTAGCRNYGMTDSGKVVTQWPLLPSTYQQRTREVEWSDFSLAIKDTGDS